MIQSTGIIELLGKHRQKFQLKSGTDKLPSSEAFFATEAKSTSSFERESFPVDNKVLRYLVESVLPDQITLETGGGYSTVVLTTLAKKHYSVNPDKTANELIRGFLEQHGYTHEHLVFIEDSSGNAAPRLELKEKIDLLFIDGNHSFLYPIIDWFYLDHFLNVGGRLLLDDIQINSIRLLLDFLTMGPFYRVIKKLGTCIVLEKIAETQGVGWADQLMNQRVFKGWAKHNVTIKKIAANVVKFILPNPVLDYLRKFRA